MIDHVFQSFEARPKHTLRNELLLLGTATWPVYIYIYITRLHWNWAGVIEEKKKSNPDLIIPLYNRFQSNLSQFTSILLGN